MRTLRATPGLQARSESVSRIGPTVRQDNQVGRPWHPRGSLPGSPMAWPATVAVWGLVIFSWQRVVLC